MTGTGNLFAETSPPAGGPAGGNVWIHRGALKDEGDHDELCRRELHPWRLR